MQYLQNFTIRKILQLIFESAAPKLKNLDNVFIAKTKLGSNLVKKMLVKFLQRSWLTFLCLSAKTKNVCLNKWFCSQNLTFDLYDRDKREYKLVKLDKFTIVNLVSHVWECQKFDKIKIEIKIYNDFLP